MTQNNNVSLAGKLFKPSVPPSFLWMKSLTINTISIINTITFLSSIPGRTTKSYQQLAIHSLTLRLDITTNRPIIPAHKT